MFILMVIAFFVVLGFLLVGIGIYTTLASRRNKSWQKPPRPPKFFGLDGKPRTLTPKELKKRKSSHVTRRTAESSSHIHRTDDSLSTASLITHSTVSTNNAWSDSGETNWNTENSNSSSSSDWSSSSNSDTSWGSSSDYSSSSSDSSSSSSSDFGGGGSGGDW